MRYSRKNLGSQAHAALGLLRGSSHHHGIGGTSRSCGRASLHMHQDILPPLASAQHGLGGDLWLPLLSIDSRKPLDCKLF